MTGPVERHAVASASGCVRVVGNCTAIGTVHVMTCHDSMLADWPTDQSTEGRGNCHWQLQVVSSHTHTQSKHSWG